VDERQLDRLGDVVERKKQEAKARSEQTRRGRRRDPELERDGPGVKGEQPDLIEHGRPQDTLDARAKSAGKGKKTSDKWNQ
jgi:hypothetical protein